MVDKLVEKLMSSLDLFIYGEIVFLAIFSNIIIDCLTIDNEQLTLFRRKNINIYKTMKSYKITAEEEFSFQTRKSYFTNFKVV